MIRNEKSALESLDRSELLARIAELARERDEARGAADRMQQAAKNLGDECVRLTRVGLEIQKERDEARWACTNLYNSDASTNPKLLALQSRVASLESALKGLLAAAHVMQSSYSEMHDSDVLRECVADPMDAATTTARAALATGQEGEK